MQNKSRKWVLGIAKWHICSNILQDTKYPELLDEKVLSYETKQKQLLLHTLYVNTLQQDSKAEFHVKIKNNKVGSNYRVTWFVWWNFSFVYPWSFIQGWNFFFILLKFPFSPQVSD